MISAVLLLAVLLVAVSAAEFNVTAAPPTVASLDVPAYLGLWYQMSADAIVLNTFEKDAFCATAVYGDNGDGTISVRNYAAIGSQTGKPYTIDGYAYQSDAANAPGKLKVVFKSSEALPFPFPYWIVDLGPVNAKGLYDWAIVSDNVGSTLFVLARDVEMYNKQYKALVDKKVVALGFVGKKASIDLYQGSDCVYESTLRRQQIAKLSA